MAKSSPATQNQLSRRLHRCGVSLAGRCPTGVRWEAVIREIWPLRAIPRGAISRGIDSKLMFPWSDGRIFWIFLLGGVCRTHLVPKRANLRNRKFSDPPTPLQNASFSADHRWRPSCVLRLKLGPADASGCWLHSPRQNDARGDPLLDATCTHSGSKQRFWTKSEGIIGEKGSSQVESCSPDVPGHLATRPDPKNPDPATQQLSRWRCTLW